MTIYDNDKEIEIKNIMFKNFSEDLKTLKDKFEKSEIDFLSIHLLRGNKELLERAFKEIKEE